MADTKRSQIIKEQIDALKAAAPPQLSQAERDQIMKGRKGQADIDAGRAAIKARADEIDKHNAKINDLYTKLESAGKDEDAEKQRTETESRRKEREQNANPMMNTFLPAAAGAAGGAAIGEVENRILHGFNKGNARAIVEIGNELGPTDKMTNSMINRSRAVGAATAAEKFAPSGPIRQGAAVLGRGLSYGVPAGIFYNEYQKYEDRANDKGRSEADQLANQRIANGLLGVSTGIAADGGMRFFFPSRHEGEGEAMMRINAARDFARRWDEREAAGSQVQPQSTNRMLRTAEPQTIDVTPEPVASRPTPAIAPPQGQQAAPKETKALTPGTRAYMEEQARGLGIRGATRMTKSNLADALSKALSEHGGKRTRGPKASSLGPVIGGAVGAAAALTDRAKASERGETSPRSAIGDAATAGGVAAGTAYGANKLLQAIPAGGGAMFGEAMAPSAVDAMTDYSPDDIAQGRNWIARNIPAARHLGGGFAQGYEDAQLPTPGDRSDEALLRRSQVDQEASMPMEAASALEVPQMAPQGQQEAPEADPFDDEIADLVSMLKQMGVEEEQQSPVQQSMRSQAVARQQAPQWQAPALPQNRMIAAY